MNSFRALHLVALACLLIPARIFGQSLLQLTVNVPALPLVSGGDAETLTATGIFSDGTKALFCAGHEPAFSKRLLHCRAIPRSGVQECLCSSQEGGARIVHESRYSAQSHSCRRAIHNHHPRDDHYHDDTDHDDYYHKHCLDQYQSSEFTTERATGR